MNIQPLRVCVCSIQLVFFTSVRVLVEQIQLISRKCLNVIGDDVVK